MADCERWMALSRKQIEREMAEGMPHRRDKRGRILFPWPAARIWRDERIRELAKREALPTPEKDVRLRKMQGDVDLQEIDLARLRRELVPIMDAEQAIAEAFERVRAHLLNLPSRLGAAGVGHKSPREAQTAFEPLVYEVMEALQAGEDVPIEETAV